MTGASLFSVYGEMVVDDCDDADGLLFVVKAVSASRSYFIGRDSAGKACLLIASVSESGRRPAPIILQNLDAQFEMLCRVKGLKEGDWEGRFTVVRCRASESVTIQYFYSICEIIMRHLGDAFSREQVATAVERIASIFRNIRKPSVRDVNGLFGELFVISRSRSTAQAIDAWRIDEKSRFDFSVGDVRMEVKTCAGRSRVHTFSYDQCNPPVATHAVVASLMIERIPRGLSMANLISQIELQVTGDEDLIFKFRSIIASTLGESLAESLRVTFDSRLADDTLEFFDLREIPAVRGPLSSGVSHVRFVADLSGANALGVEILTDRDANFWELLPEQQGRSS